MLAEPTITGDAVISEKLTVNPGAWTSPYGDKITVTYYWSRCNPDNTGCEYVHTGKTHTVESDDLDHIMSVMIWVVDRPRDRHPLRLQPGHARGPARVPVEPSIVGDAVISEKLTVNPGAWSSPYGDTVKLSYYWRRCNPDNTGCEYVHTGRTHTVESDDLDHIMSVMIWASTDHGIAIRYAFSPVMHEVEPVPAIAPSILGDAVLSEKLTVNPGAWSSAYGDTVKLSYYWRRCDPDNTHCEYQHTGKTHTVEPGDADHIMSVMIWASTDHGIAIRYAFSPVMHAVPPVDLLPPVLNGTPRQGSKLTVAPGVWSSPYGDPIKLSYFWSRCNADGTGCTYLHTGSSHTLGRDDVGHYLRVMVMADTDHGGAIRYVQSDVVS